MAAAVLATWANAAGSEPHPTAAAEREFLARNDTAMATMHVGMEIRPRGDVDADFAAMIIPHHQGAIDMAVLELRYGRNEQLRRIAREIIVDQQQEIATPCGWRLASSLPVSAPAPTVVDHSLSPRVPSRRPDPDRDVATRPAGRSLEPLQATLRRRRRPEDPGRASGVEDAEPEPAAIVVAGRQEGVPHDCGARSSNAPVTRASVAAAVQGGAVGVTGGGVVLRLQQLDLGCG